MYAATDVGHMFQRTVGLSQPLQNNPPPHVPIVLVVHCAFAGVM